MQEFYKFAIYGKFGTGKTTFLTKYNNALVLDINEDGNQQKMGQLCRLRIIRDSSQ